METNQKWTFRYQTYARNHGYAPDDMMANDTELWPGGKMTGYIRWVMRAWGDFMASNGFEADQALEAAALIRDVHPKFDAWLAVNRPYNNTYHI